MTSCTLTVEYQSWPLAQIFRIARGEKIQADVLLVSIQDGEHIGRAEAVPYARYHETVDSVIQQIESFRSEIENGASLNFINQHLPAGAARNALDCATWELEAKKQKCSVARLASIEPSSGCITAQTLSIDTSEVMALQAKKLARYPLVKVKLNQQNVLSRMTAVHQELPESKFIIDANEAWTISELNRYSEKLRDMRVVLIEQPLPAEHNEKLKQYTGAIPICADESIHIHQDLKRIEKYYHYVNIKLDKTGGLSEAIKLLGEAKAKRLGIMIGCMVGTSLAMAPAALLTNYADYVDLDGPALLAKDRQHGFQYIDGKMSALNPLLWGGHDKIARTNRQFRLFHKL